LLRIAAICWSGVQGELADELDGVLVGAVAFGAALDQRHGQPGARAALPDDLHLRPPRRLLDGDDHLADECAEQLLAVTRGDGLGCPQPREIPGEPDERLPFGWGVVFPRFGGHLSAGVERPRRGGCFPDAENETAVSV
jgi:hypothetical protein